MTDSPGEAEVRLWLFLLNDFVPQPVTTAWRPVSASLSPKGSGRQAAVTAVPEPSFILYRSRKRAMSFSTERLS